MSTRPRLLFLVRHGRSDFTATDAFREHPLGPQWDPPLDATGREQAELLARRLMVMPRPEAIYCSPMRRTRETIAPFIAETGVEVRYDDDLQETHVGEWEGLTFEEVLAKDAELLQRFRAHETVWVMGPGAEDPRGLRARVARAVDRILAAHEGDVLIVCHGQVINSFLAPLIGLDGDTFFLPDNTSINTVAVEGDRRSIRFLNDVRHLSDPYLFTD